MQFKKGDRVEWDWQDNQTHYGTIQRKAGDMYKVVEDGHPEELWTIHNARLRSTNRPLPKDTIKTPADIYEVRMFKNVGTGTDGFIYTGKIFKDGKHVLDIVDDGGGGPMLFHRVKKGDTTSLEEFFKAIGEWWTALGGTTTSEPEALWVDWQVNEKPYGITGETYVRRFEEHMASLMTRKNTK